MPNFAIKERKNTLFNCISLGEVMLHLDEDLILQGGVDTKFIKWIPYDGIGRTVRKGLNFTKRGFGIRGAKGTSDHGQTAASQLRPGDINREEIFGTSGSRDFTQEVFLQHYQRQLLKLQ